MKVSPQTTVGQFCEQFRSFFPYLKMEFYPIGGTENNACLSHDLVFGDINPEIYEHEFIVDHDISVAKFEQFMKSFFGLEVQVFRKSADLWLQTRNTDDWSLQKQNIKGEHSTLDYDIRPITALDFDMI